MNYTSLDEWGCNPPNLLKLDRGSSYHRGAFPTGESVPHTEAAAFTRPNTSVIGGRSVRLVCQQSPSRSQSLSERPSFGAFAGFGGLPSDMTSRITSVVDRLLNGGDPVSTYTGWVYKRMGYRSHDSYLVYCHSHRVYVGFLRRNALVQTELPRHKKLRRRERNCFPA